MAKKEKNSPGDQGGVNAEIASSASATEGSSKEETMATTHEAVGSATSIFPALGPQVEPVVPEKLSTFQDVASNSDDDGPDYIDRLIQRSRDESPEEQKSSEETSGDGEAALVDGQPSYGIDKSVLNKLVDEVKKADCSGEETRINAGYRIREVCFGNDKNLMASRSHYKSVTFSVLAQHPRNTVDESTLRGWMYGSIVHEDLGNNNITTDPPLTISLLNLLHRTKNPKVWRELAPEVAGMKVRQAKDHIKTRTGKKTSESTADMILKQLRNPLRAMTNEELVSLITDPDLLTGRLDDEEVHGILGEFGKIKKPVQDFLTTMEKFHSILTDLIRSHAA